VQFKKVGKGSMYRIFQPRGWWSQDIEEEKKEEKKIYIYI